MKEHQWHPLYQEIGPEYRIQTNQEWAEGREVPNGLATKKNGPDYRFIAIREPLEQKELFDTETEQLPFLTQELNEQGRYKVFGTVTNRTLLCSELIHWHRQRCGNRCQAHSVMKEDIAYGRLPSGDFGENAAWWVIMLLAFNLNSLMKHLVLPSKWADKRLKASSEGVINIAGRVIERHQKLIVRLSGNHPVTSLLFDVRQKIMELALVPSG